MQKPETINDNATSILHTYRLIDPLPRTRNRFLAPLTVFTPPLKRNAVYKCNEESDVGDVEDGIIEDVVRDDERAELLKALAEEEEY